MKTFRQYLAEEKQSVYNSGFNLSRSSMPQLKDIDAFLAFLSNHDEVGDSVTIKNWISTVDHLLPTQNEYDIAKVERLVDMVERGDQIKPIITSSDGYVVDGHHRYFAADQLGASVPFMEIGLPLNKLMKVALEYANG